jgi:hypothetical protein|tara:strand:- start:1270 stop:1551 length:282 start_codon:yes stop_codon:yes gene_type:complete
MSSSFVSPINKSDIKYVNNIVTSSDRTKKLRDNTIFIDLSNNYNKNLKLTRYNNSFTTINSLKNGKCNLKCNVNDTLTGETLVDTSIANCFLN